MTFYAGDDANAARVRQMLTDTGYMARNVLGHNYDIDWRTGKRCRIGTGGVRNEHPYSTMASFVQDENKKLKLLLAPRGSLKSTIAESDCTRFILAHPDDAVLYVMRTDTQVWKKSLAIRNNLAKNEVIKSAFGDLQGEPWVRTSFSTKYWDPSRDVPTFTGASLKTPPTGGHYRKIYVDDLQDDTNVQTELQLQQVRDVIDMLFPMLLPGGEFVYLNTRYHALDGSTYIENKVDDRGRPLFETLILGSGYNVVENDKGLPIVQGEGIFPSLEREYMQAQLSRMSDGLEIVKFLRQYNNVHTGSMRQVFKRHWFQRRAWEPWMHDLTGWILTDTATSLSRTADFTALLYFGMTKDRTFVLLDGIVGRMESSTLIDEMFALINKWKTRVNHAGVVMESSATGTLRSWLDQHARTSGEQLNLRVVQRTGGVANKNKRISRMEPPMRAGKFWVLDTFPKYFRDGGRNRVLWDPEGYTDPQTGQKQPGGEMVEQFVQFPDYPKKDIADATADIEYFYENTKEPACYWMDRSPRESRLDTRHSATAVSRSVGAPKSPSPWTTTR